MSLIYEELKNNSIVDKVAYAHTKVFAKVSTVKQPETPLGPNWKFQPCVHTLWYTNFGQQIYDFECRADDLFIITYPKAGTTWTQTMVWLLQNNLDYELEKCETLTERFPFIEYATLFAKDEQNFDSIKRCINLPSPRNIKTHLPVALLPHQLWTVKPKIIYVARNPKDVALSFYHHYRNMQGYLGTFDEYMEAFLADLMVDSPFHEHVIEFWEMRNEPNILFLTYEEMKIDLFSVVKRASEFLGKSYSDDQLHKLCQHLSVDQMRSNRTSNNEYLLKDLQEKLGFKQLDDDFKFIRKGQSGSFREEMTPELIERFDKWTMEKLKNTDFRFLM